MAPLTELTLLLLVCVGGPVGLGGLLSFALRRGRPFKEAWRRLLSEVAGGALVPEPESDLSTGAAEGTVRGRQVRIGAGADRIRGRLALVARLELDTGLPLSAEPGGGAGVATGDPALDGSVDLRGDPAMVSALASPSAREALRGLVADGARLVRGTWIVEREGLFPSAAAIDAWLDRLGAFADGAAPVAADPRSALLARLGDPVAGVRAEAAVRLVALDPDTLPAAAPALREGLARGDLRAALALSALGPDAEVEAVLLGAVADDDPAVLEALGRIGSPACAAALRPLAERFLAPSGPAREALRAVVERSGAHRGALALASDGSGGLSLAPTRNPEPDR